MIIITGDVHGELGRFSDKLIPSETALTEKDFVIICGDFGFVFFNNEPEGSIPDLQKKAELDSLEEKPYTILFVDGNHENFNALSKYPEELWNGGRVHRIRKNVLHLMRGQVFTIEGKTFFTLGGAFSTDRLIRELNHSFWNEEIPSSREIEEARESLARYGYSVDYVLTHQCPPAVITEIFHESPKREELEFLGHLNDFAELISFDRWFFGHWHRDMSLGRYRALYTDCEIIE